MSGWAACLPACLASSHFQLTKSHKLLTLISLSVYLTSLHHSFSSIHPQRGTMGLFTFKFTFVCLSSRNNLLTEMNLDHCAVLCCALAINPYISKQDATSCAHFRFFYRDMRRCLQACINLFCNIVSSSAPNSRNLDSPDNVWIFCRSLASKHHA